MKTHHILVIDDSPPSGSELQQIASALRKEFAHLDATFDVEKRETNLLKEPIDIIALEINSSEPIPIILLVDANMPNHRDGVRLISALRRVGYAGFTYLWSGADPSSDVESFPAMLKQIGSGGFTSTQVTSLAAKVRSDWEACGKTFQVSDPANMSLLDPVESALQILSEFLPGCILSEFKGNDSEDWDAAYNRALSLFRVQPGNFRSIVSSFPGYSALRLEDASDALQLLHKTDANDHTTIFKVLGNLRDALLDVAVFCQDAAGFRV